MANFRGVAGKADNLVCSPVTDKILFITDGHWGAGAKLWSDPSVSIAGKGQIWDYIDGAGGNVDRIYGLVTSEVLLYQDTQSPLAPGHSKLDRLHSIESVDMGAGNDVVDFSARPGTTPYTLDIRLIGSGGDDYVRGGAGDDRVFGGIDNDFVDGGPGNDRVDGWTGTDKLHGGTGNDTMLGGPGNDLVLGEAGNDAINAGEGNDRLGGGTGIDDLFGSSGNDVYVFERASGNDTVRGFVHGQDKLEFHDVPGIDNFGDLSISRVGANSFIDADSAGFIKIQGVMSLQASDFLFT